MKKIILFLWSVSALAQVKIGNDASTAHPSARLEVLGGDKGLLLPKVNENSNIDHPAAGLIAYNNTLKSPQYFDGNTWQGMNSGQLALQFPRTISIAGTTGGYSAGTALSTQTNVTLPAGTTKIWIELWAGGEAGNTVTSNFLTNYFQSTGGSGGSYISAIVDVSAELASGNNQLVTFVGNGGSGGSYTSGGNSGIYTLNFTPILLVNNGAQGLSYSLPTHPNYALLKIATGEKGRRPQSEYVKTLLPGQSVETSLMRVTPGAGGASYGGNAGIQASAYSINISNGTIVENSYPNILNLLDGHFPGGGGSGTAAYATAGRGAGGLVLIHY